jgi:hypothetical protein
MVTEPSHLARHDSYLRVLCVVLMCYAIAGKGFAYLGYPPIFIGELLLLAGLFVWIETRLAGLNAAVPAQLLVIAFMLWGAFRTLPGIGQYGVDALRDAVVWGYAVFALIVAGLLTARPQRLADLDRAFFKFVKLFVAITPFAFVFGMWGSDYIPELPGSNMPVFGPYKTSDAMLHLTGCFAYLSVCLPSMSLIRPWMLAAMGLSIVANFNGRAGMVAFACGALIVIVLRPLNKLALGTFVMAAVGLGFFWITDVKIELPPSGRYLSFEQFTENVSSITGDTRRDELDGSRHWRLEWWNTIFDYTFRGPYFWTGKGFGINLANSDGFQVHADNSLRSPHNGHLTILARAGVPGFALWMAAQLAWAFMVFDAFVRAARAKERRWTGMFVFLMAYWAAFMVNIAFDVFLEGPVGGIWFWTLFGVGVAAVRIHRQSPEVLKDEPAAAVAKHAQRQPRVRRSNVRTLPVPALPTPRRLAGAMLP